jgi:hypothetical protein
METSRFAARCALAALALLASAAPAGAYPEYQKFVQANSGRAVNCALCHTNPDGPDGAGVGQIGRLTPEELGRLGEARAAFEPGRDVDSPILNAFGDRIVEAAGKTRFLEMRSRPAELAGVLGTESDLDGDGIPDSREYLDGTHPLMAANGDPWLLFVHNLARYRFHVFMIVAATALTTYGLTNILRGTHAAHAATAEEDEARV